MPYTWVGSEDNPFFRCCSHVTHFPPDFFQFITHFPPDFWCKITHFLLLCTLFCNKLFKNFFRRGGFISFYIIARNEAIQKTTGGLDCFVVPPRNDAKRVKELSHNYLLHLNIVAIDKTQQINSGSCIQLLFAGAVDTLAAENMT